MSEFETSAWAGTECGKENSYIRKQSRQGMLCHVVRCGAVWCGDVDERNIYQVYCLMYH